MALEEGTKLGPYEILGPLGEGAMGEVYRARDTRLGRQVAIKVLPQRLAANADALSRFEREAKSLAAISHPNILTVYDVGFELGLYFVVTELLEGETLRRRMQQSVLNWDAALQIAIEIAEGLSTAHSQGVIHRDLKPENVFLVGEHRVKILDFGLARWSSVFSSDVHNSVLPTEVLPTTQGTVLGTIAYMSPEQVRGETADERSDLFSFGCILYEMINGVRPFAGNLAVETMASILRDRPRESQRPIPVELHRIIEKCLAKNPGKRFGSAPDLLQELKMITSNAVLTVVTRPARARKKGPVNSIAIVPLNNATADPELEYLSDGITESIINTLSQIPKLRVMARSTVFRYKGVSIDPLVVGQELNVRAVLTGRLWLRGEELNIQTELVDTSNGSQLWGHQYHRDMCNLPKLQEEMAQSISENLQLRLLKDQKKRIARQYTQSPEAYKLYLQGRFHWNKRNVNAVRKAIEHFEQAIEQDPMFALAYVGLSDCYSLLGGFSYMPSAGAYIKARAAVMRALEIDDSLGEAHTTLGVIYERYDWDWAGAEREFQRALVLNPGYATAFQWYGDFLLMMGRFGEARVELERAQNLDPLSLPAQADLAYFHYCTRNYDEALAQYQKMVSTDPGFVRAHVDLGLVYTMKGMYEKAIESIQPALAAASGYPAVRSALTYIYAAAGRKTEALAALQELQSSDEYLSPFSVSAVYVALGEFDVAFQWLEKAFEMHLDPLVSLKVNPRFDPVRDDPRFIDLLKRIGLPL